MLVRIKTRIRIPSKKLYSTLEATKTVSKTLTNEISSENSLLDEIVENSLKKSKPRTWADILPEIQTVEEKVIKINMPRYYGYKVLKLEDKLTPYNSFMMTKHYTNTHFVEKQAFPEYYQDYNIDDATKKVIDSVVECIEFSNDYHRFRKANEESGLDEFVVKQLNECLLKNLSGMFKHLNEMEIDYNPRHEAFWWTGGIQPSKNVRKSLEGLDGTKEKAKNPTTRAIQYSGKPYIALRHNMIIKPFNNVFEIESGKIQELIPLFEYDARTLGYTCEYRHGTIIPGYWPGNLNEFGFINFQRRINSIEQNRFLPRTEDIMTEAMHVKGMQSSFAWLFAQACYQGFSNFEDIEKPLTTQTIITDGRKFSFYGYQLNTTLARNDNITDNKKFNTCWGTKDMALYEKVDENGKLVGFNEDVLKNIIRFYANIPSIKQNKKAQRISDIKDDERREFLEKTFKHLVSNRPRNRLVPEIYLWEKIYKIDNNTRSLESKRRFFELGINPFKRQLDHHKPVYIPRDLRPDGYKSKKRWTKTYYP